jgi:hypothetical protein
LKNIPACWRRKNMQPLSQKCFQLIRHLHAESLHPRQGLSYETSIQENRLLRFTAISLPIFAANQRIVLLGVE